MNDLEWKILTIDNIPSFNKIIEIIAGRLSFKNRKLSVLKASSLEEGKEILSRNSDVALILVDIMMEEKASSLEFIKYVRKNLKNQESRIVLRTGYPDSLPEQNVINNYEIDGYISKEVNSQLEIEVSIITAIRNYYQILSTKETLQSLAGSIAHELRNPLNAINLAQNQIQESLSNPNYDSKELKEKLTNLSLLTTESVVQANHIINIILNDLNQKPINPSEFSYLNPSYILPEIIKKFGYQNEQERKKINLILSSKGKNNFLFKAVTDRFTFIMYNLLKNALYYLDQYPNTSITIGNELRIVGKREYNVIYVYDTGPGIHPETMSKLFDNFYTSGKKGGTGLGLPFCKRNMNLFGGDIICESEFNQEKNDGKNYSNNGWTKFSLLFPTISKEEIEEVNCGSEKKILLIGSDQMELNNTTLEIKKGLPNMSCDVAQRETEIVSLLKKTKYYLVLIDVDTAKFDAFEAAQKIGIYDKEIPIIAFTSLDRGSFLNKAKKESNNKFSGYLSKSSSGNVFYRGLTKWMTDFEDDFSYLVSKTGYLENLKNKKVILVDDGKMNRLLTKRILENHGIKTTEAKDGKGLLKIFRNSLNDGKSEFDLILTDINMPPYNGDEAAREIRKIEVMNNVHQNDEIPIIALSGNGAKKDIHRFFDSHMTDYFIKGSNTEILIKIVANYIKT
jgi:CheY-like chemotaxis protein